ncbi:MAG: replication initiation protein, partial [Ruminococcus sp.]|nr:replication initiation protein [Ruminococcus sp.]
MLKIQEKDKSELSELVGNLKGTDMVQKRTSLFSLWKSALTLSEFKILDTYLSRINSRDPEHRTVVFEKGELERLLGVTKINQPELKERLRHLQGTILSVGEGKNIDEITLFERSQAIQDEYGLWQIKLTASLSAMKYIFNIEKIGYFRYQIRNIAKIKSLHSYILFTYFEYYMQGNKCKWTIELEKLKKMLNCTAQCYLEFKEFNRLVLKKCQKEIAEKTDLSFTCSTVRKNRKVAIIVFEVERVKRIDETFIEKKSVPEQLPEKQLECITPITEQTEPKPKQETLTSGNFRKRTMEADFTPEQIENLCDMLEIKLDNNDPVYIRKVLQGLYANMKLSAKSKINDRMAYLKAMIKNLEIEPIKEKNNRKSDPDIEKYKFVINNIPEP